MSNYSFYGGRDGRPFIINRSFKTIKEMIDGIGNIQIGEYCIINTDDFNHPDNGKIFRRDFPGGFKIIHNFRENTGTEENPKWSAYRKEQLDGNGAKLIGQIVGPAGPAAQIKLSKYNNIKDLKPADLAEGYYEKSYEEGSLDLGEGEALLDPEAETKEGEENNRIYWASCTLRDSNNLDSVCTVGFKIPFTKVIFTASSENAYYQRDENGVHQNLITRNEDFYGQSNGKINPFIQNWDIKIPKGIKGDSIEDLTLDPNTGLITYDIRNFDAKADGTETHYTLNQNYPLTWITSVALDPETGKLDIDTNNQKNDLEANLTWVKNLKIGEDGLLNTITTTGENQIKDQQLHWIKSIETAADGTVTYTEVDGKTKTSQPQLINWITNLSFDDAGNIAIKTNNNNIKDIQRQITWISKVERPENTQVLAIDFNNSTAGSQRIEANLKTPNSIYTTEDGLFKADYNTGETKTLGRMFYQGAEEPTDLTVGGLWIETIEVGE